MTFKSVIPYSKGYDNKEIRSLKVVVLKKVDLEDGTIAYTETAEGIRAGGYMDESFINKPLSYYMIPDDKEDYYRSKYGEIIDELPIVVGYKEKKIKPEINVGSPIHLFIPFNKATENKLYHLNLLVMIDKNGIRKPILSIKNSGGLKGFLLEMELEGNQLFYDVSKEKTEFLSQYHDDIEEYIETPEGILIKNPEITKNKNK